MATHNFSVGVLFGLALILLSGVACAPGSNTATWWYTDPPDVFHTNNVERAEAQVPFTIVLPNYLPDHLDPRPYIRGPVAGSCPPDMVSIIAKYQTKGGGDYLVWIEEINHIVTVHPTTGTASVHVPMAGIDVLQYETHTTMFGEDGAVQHGGTNFSWNERGMTLQVTIYNYDNAEGEKLVGSMIQQRATNPANEET